VGLLDERLVDRGQPRDEPRVVREHGLAPEEVHLLEGVVLAPQDLKVLADALVLAVVDLRPALWRPSVHRWSPGSVLPLKALSVLGRIGSWSFNHTGG